jgi:hypothetical protein
VLGDLVVDVPPESQVHRQVVRKDLDARAFELDPVVRLHTVDVTEPDSPRRPGTSGGCSMRCAPSGASTTCAPTCRHPALQKTLTEAPTE